eukprot:265142-Alexandrium_andersonii.AAC.1
MPSSKRAASGQTGRSRMLRHSKEVHRGKGCQRAEGAGGAQRLGQGAGREGQGTDRAAVDSARDELIPRP